MAGKATALAELFIENFEKYTDTPAGEALASAAIEAVRDRPDGGFEQRQR